MYDLKRKAVESDGGHSEFFVLAGESRGSGYVVWGSDVVDVWFGCMVPM